jgi:hypothetical protein
MLKDPFETLRGDVALDIFPQILLVMSSQENLTMAGNIRTMKSMFINACKLHQEKHLVTQ